MFLFVMHRLYFIIFIGFNVDDERTSDDSEVLPNFLINRDSASLKYNNMTNITFLKLSVGIFTGKIYAILVAV